MNRLGVNRRECIDHGTASARWIQLKKDLLNSGWRQACADYRRAERRSLNACPAIQPKLHARFWSILIK
jgi:hypothetical protein